MGFETQAVRSNFLNLRFAVILIISFLMQGQPALSQAPDEVLGEIEHTIADNFKNGTAQERFRVRDARLGKMIELRFSKKPDLQLHHGMKVKVRGKRSGQIIDVESLVPQDSSGTSLDSGATTTQALVPVTERRVAIILVNLLNANSLFDYTGASALMFSNTNSVANRYLRTSMGHIRFTGDADGDGKYDVFGPFTVNYSAPNCNEDQLSLAANTLAQAQGVDFSRYNNVIYVFPSYSTLGCSWAGRAEIGCGTNCRSWLAYSHPSTFTHELGHNLGMGHASTDPENDGVVNSEYGDVSDEMGTAYANRNFNAPHLAHMGWLNPFPGLIRDVSSPGRYDIAAIDTTPELASYPYALRIAKASGGYYYISLRQAVGEDATIGAAYTAGANVHYHRYAYGNTHFIKTLASSAIFTDPTSGLSVSQLTSPANGLVSVYVDYTCVSAAPTFSFSPSSQSASPGASVTYKLTVTNRDVSVCGATTFSLSSVLPAGVTGQLSSTSLTLAPGASGSVNLVLTAPSTTGTYSLSATVSAPGHANVTAAGSLTVNTKPTRGGGGGGRKK